MHGIGLGTHEPASREWFGGGSGRGRFQCWNPLPEVYPSFGHSIDMNEIYFNISLFPLIAYQHSITSKIWIVTLMLKALSSVLEVIE